jgi:arylsulfatase A-like enzyme
MTADQIREINAITHIENELIDDACGRVINWLKNRGWYDNSDIIFTTDHGEFQCDYGLLFKGPYHVDALMRLPMIWHPTASTQTPAATVSLPVGHRDLASTFCEIAGIDTPPSVQGLCLPRSDSEALAQAREDVITEWDSEHAGTTLHLKSIYHKSGWLCTVDEKSSLYERTEGELYDMNAEPEQRVNLWDDLLHRATRDDLIENLYDKLPRPREPRLPRKALCLMQQQPLPQPDIHSYIHTFIHSYIHTFIHSYIHTFLHSYIGCGGPAPPLLNGLN